MHLRDEVKAFESYPETCDPQYVGHGSQTFELESLVQARRFEEAQQVLQRESASPFAKMLLQGSQADFRARIISYQRFRVRQVVLAELAERVTCVHAIEELWELYLHFHDHRTSERRGNFMEDKCLIKATGWLPWPAFRLHTVRVSSQGRLDVLDYKGVVVYTLESLQDCEIQREQTGIRLRAAGRHDMVLQAEKKGQDSVALSSPMPAGWTPGESAETDWMIVSAKSVVEYRNERLYRMLEFAQRGFRHNSPSLARFDKDHDGKDSLQSALLHDKDRFERFRQKAISLHQIAHNQLCKAAPRAFSYRFLNWCFEDHLPGKLMVWVRDVNDPSPYFDGAAARERRKQLRKREQRLKQIEERLLSPEAVRLAGLMNVAIA